MFILILVIFHKIINIEGGIEKDVQIVKKDVKKRRYEMQVFE